MAQLLGVDELHAGYGDRQVLWDVTISVRQQETSLLVGPNGSGKSTLLKAITGVIEVLSGSVTFKGTRIDRETTENRVHRGIAYLPQSHDVFPNLTVADNLCLSAWGIPASEFEERRAWVLEKFTFVADKLEKRAGLLSGGERRALAISMVMLKRAELYLLDEPTAGLSPKAAKFVLGGVRAVQEQTGAAVLLVEHNFRYLEGWADRVYVMSQGRIAGEETDITKLLSRERLEKHYFGRNGLRVED